jgi:hypothetical protein
MFQNPKQIKIVNESEIYPQQSHRMQMRFFRKVVRGKTFD